MSQTKLCYRYFPDASATAIPSPLLPVFAAAVASGKTTFDSVFENKPGAVFFETGCISLTRDGLTPFSSTVYCVMLLKNKRNKNDYTLFSSLIEQSLSRSTEATLIWG